MKKVMVMENKDVTDDEEGGDSAVGGKWWCT